MSRVALFLAAGVLAACVKTAEPPRVEPVPIPPPRPERPEPPGPTPLSEKTSAYYASVQANLLSRGQLRKDQGREITLDLDRVVRSYIRIAFYTEYAERGGFFVSQPQKSRLQRWERPISVGVVTGPSVPPEKAKQGRAEISAFASRLGRITGHPVSMTSGEGNFTVLFLSEDDRLGWGHELSRLMPGISGATRRAIIDMSPSTYCLVVARDEKGSNAYVQAVAVIRAEHPDLLRQSCIHEELAQGLGLANDDPTVRPSVFNDDEEFALLTWLDEIMLRIHYDKRLRPGMTEAEATPIVRQIAEELLGGPA